MFASGEQAAAIQAEAGAVIPARNGSAETWVQALPQYDLQIFVDAVDGSVPYPISLNRAEWGQMETDLFPQIWSGSLSAEDGLSQLAQEMQTVLDAEQR